MKRFWIIFAVIAMVAIGVQAFALDVNAYVNPKEDNTVYIHFSSEGVGDAQIFVSETKEFNEVTLVNEMKLDGSKKRYTYHYVEESFSNIFYPNYLYYWVVVKLKNGEVEISSDSVPCKLKPIECFFEPEVGENSIVWSWEGVPGATGYVVYSTEFVSGKYWEATDYIGRAGDTSFKQEYPVEQEYCLRMQLPNKLLPGTTYGIKVEPRRSIAGEDEPPSFYKLSNPVFATTLFTTGVAGIVENYHIFQNYPNPFNPSTTIEYQLKNSGNVRLVIYNQLGQQVAKLVDEFQTPGIHRITWNAFDQSAGVYFYRLETNDAILKIGRMSLLK